MRTAVLALLLSAADPEPPEYAAARLLARAAAADPPIEEVQQAAASAVARGGGSARRARLAALVPRVTAELRADDQRYRVVGLTGTSEVDYVRHTPGAAVALKLSWDLPDAVHAEAELRVASQARDAAKDRRDAVERATRLYFERQRLRIAIASGAAATPRERAELQLRVQELAAELDALTAGAFTRGSR